MDEDRKPTPQSGDDQALLREIRERYTYASDAWEEVRKERQKDMRHICGNPWDDDDRKAREAAGRPVVNHDELNQYVNQAVNNLRQNKRGIKVEPGGNGADGKTAGTRQDLIRTIEYRNKAQDAYLRAGQDMLEGSYGYFRIGRKYVIDNPIDSERDYQERLARNTCTDQRPLEQLALIRQVLAEIDRDWYYSPGPVDMNKVRKIAGIAVRCMEQHGAPKRGGFKVLSAMIKTPMDIDGTVLALQTAVPPGCETIAPPEPTSSGVLTTYFGDVRVVEAFDPIEGLMVRRADLYYRENL